MILTWELGPVPQASSTPKKNHHFCANSETEIGKKMLLAELSTKSICFADDSFSSLALTTDDCYGDCDDVSSPDATLRTVYHDHRYTERPASTSSSTSSSVSDASSSRQADESLQNLFDTCDVDPVFLEEAEPVFQQFLEDLTNSSDVPSDDLFADLDKSESQCCAVRAKVSSCLVTSPSTAPCLFTFAGSADTHLSTSLTPNTALCTAQPSASRDGTPSCPRSSSFEEKVQGILSLLDGKEGLQSDGQSALTSADVSDLITSCGDASSSAVDDVLCQTKQPLSEEGDSVPVSRHLHHKVCRSCHSVPTAASHPSTDTDKSPRVIDGSSASASSHDKDNNNTQHHPLSDSTLLTASPAGSAQQSEHPSSSPSPSQQCCGKRKSDSDCDGNARDSLKRARLASDDDSDVFSRSVSPALERDSEYSCDDEVTSATEPHLSRGFAAKHDSLLSYVSFVDRTAANYKPLSPIGRITQLQRCV